MQLDLFPDHPPHLSPALLARIKARIWVDPIRKCWCWTGALIGAGRYACDAYAAMGIDGRTRRLSRVVFVHYHGPIPVGLQVMHSCDNATCINPDHLSAGSALDNLADASRKGRLAQKLSRAQVAEILASPLTQQALADRFGVGRSAIGHHRRRHAGAALDPL